MAKNPSVRWSTELTAFGNNTGIVVPPELIEQLGQGKRPPVAVSVNGYEFRTTVGVMGGKHLVPINAAIRAAAGLAAGDAIDVTLTADTTPRTADVPADLATALDAAGVRAFFDGLSNSMQRYHVDNVNGAKTDDTRQRRIEKAVTLFREGKQR
jgi:antitoxin component of MazEF toxin-antitoxin module